MLCFLEMAFTVLFFSEYKVGREQGEKWLLRKGRSQNVIRHPCDAINFCVKTFRVGPDPSGRDGTY